jgi:hypothetical protein
VLAELGERLTAGRKGVGGFDVRRGDFDGEFEAMESCCRVCDRPTSVSKGALLFIDRLRLGGEGE